MFALQIRNIKLRLLWNSIYTHIFSETKKRIRFKVTSAAAQRSARTVRAGSDKRR